MRSSLGRLDKTLVINGDGRNSDFLYEEDVKSCDAFVAVTSSSETNILSCVAAKRMGVAKTIAEVENLEYIRLAEEIGVDSVINKKLIAASRIFRVTLSNHIRTIKCLGGSDADAIEYVVNAGSLITTAPLRSPFSQGCRYRRCHKRAGSLYCGRYHDY